MFNRKRVKAAGVSNDDNAAPPHALVVSLQTDRGCVREVNEDSGRYVQPHDPAQLARQGVLVVVADGMGGHASGERASQMAVEVVTRDYYRQERGSAGALKKAFESANEQIYRASLADPALSGMGTTCTALLLLGGQAFAAHVGDSRLYMLRGGGLYQLTEDHSAVMEMVKRGVITPEQARHHEDKNVILRALGTGPSVEVSVWGRPTRVREGDTFLLCSDGLYDLVEDEEIGRVLAAAAPHEACARLIASARERGGHDNITVGVVAVHPAGYASKQAARVTREVEAAP